MNAITDVAGVRIGHATVIRGTDVRTGVTAIAFSTATLRPYQPEQPTLSLEELPNDAVSPLFLAVVEAVEEAVLSSLTRATSVTGYQGHTVEALPLERVKELLEDGS